MHDNGGKQSVNIMCIAHMWATGAIVTLHRSCMLTGWLMPTIHTTNSFTLVLHTADVAAAAVADNCTNQPADTPCLRSAFQLGLFHGHASVLLLPPLLLLLLLAVMTRQRWFALLLSQLRRAGDVSCLLPAAVAALAGANAVDADTQRAAGKMLRDSCAILCFAVCWPERMRRFPAKACRAAAQH
jgi:hypothetical protein